jgi:hypothetical protein
MKIRIKGNSIRLRLTKTEVSQFAESGVLAETTQMMGGELVYTLRASSDVETLAAEWKSPNQIQFLMSVDLANEWTQSETVGHQHQLQLPNGAELFLLIEKDFVCLDNTFEDQSDNYPNPNAVC